MGQAPAGHMRRAALLIPGGTRVEEFEVRGREAVVGLSEEFLEGVPDNPGRRTRAQEQEL